MYSFNLRKSNPSIFFNLFIYSCFILSSTTLKAGEKEPFFKLPSTLQFHGFLSQGFLHTSDNNFFGHSDDGISVDFRELGINGSWRVMPELQLALQVVWRNAGQTDDKDLRIDYGVVNYSFFNSETTTLGIKAGRVPTPLGLYNETRDVASTRPSILLPQSIYFDRNRNIALSADGGYLYGEQSSDYGDFSFTIGAGISRADDPSLKDSIVGKDNGFEKGDLSWVTRLNYDWQNGLIRLAITYANLNSDYHPNSNSNFLPGSVKLIPLIFSAQYNAENWSLTAEYALRKLGVTGFGVFPNVNTTGESFYIQGTYTFTNFLEGLLRYDQLSVDKNDKNGNEFARQSPNGSPNYSRYAKDWTIGLRLTIIPNLMVSAEYHRVNGTAWLSSLENNKLTKHWDLYTFLISYNF